MLAVHVLRRSPVLVSVSLVHALLIRISLINSLKSSYLLLSRDEAFIFTTFRLGRHPIGLASNRLLVDSLRSESALVSPPEYLDEEVCCLLAVLG